MPVTDEDNNLNLMRNDLLLTKQYTSGILLVSGGGFQVRPTSNSIPQSTLPRLLFRIRTRVRNRSRLHIRPRILFLTSRGYIFVPEVTIVSSQALPSKGRRKVVGTATT